MDQGKSIRNKISKNSKKKKALATLKINPFLEELLQEDLTSRRRSLDRKYNFLVKKEHQTKVCKITPYVDMVSLQN